MLEFVAKAFRGWTNVILWLILIGCAVVCFLGGLGFGFGVAILGLIIGGIIGFVIVILFGGLITNFLKMVDDIDTIKNHLLRDGNTSGTGSP